MSGTRSVSRTVPATDARAAVMVAHGSPSDPDQQEAALERLAADVAAEMPGWQVRGATLAAGDALGRAFEGLPGGTPVFPVFMADGFFVGRVLPERLRAIGRGEARVLAPLGLLPAFSDHCAGMIRAALEGSGILPGAATVILAAHGSARGPRPAACARSLARELERLTGVREVRAAFIEEPPFLTDILRATEAPAICLPCFATDAGHATGDVPDAVETSGFAGQVLPVAGTAPGIARLIAREIAEAHSASRAA